MSQNCLAFDEANHRLTHRLSVLFDFVISHSAFPLTTGPQLLPKPVLHTVRSSASSFNYQYPLASLKSSSSCLRLLYYLPVTSLFPLVQWSEWPRSQSVNLNAPHLSSHLTMHQIPPPYSRR